MFLGVYRVYTVSRVYKAYGVVFLFEGVWGHRVCGLAFRVERL